MVEVVVGGGDVVVVVVVVGAVVVVVEVVVVGAVALQTVRLTVELVAAVVPAPGVCFSTLPLCDGLQLLLVLEVTLVKPLLVSVALAALRVEPTTLGTADWHGPLETVNATAEPFPTLVPAAGVVEATSPLANELEQA